MPWLARARDADRRRADQGRQAAEEQAHARGREGEEDARPQARSVRGVRADGDGIDALWRARASSSVDEVTLIIAPATTADLDAIDEIEQHSFRSPWPRDDVRGRARARVGAHRRRSRDGRAWSRSATTGWSPRPRPTGRAAHPRDRDASRRSRRAASARALLAHVLDAARAAGCSSRRSRCARGNRPAIALYERAGFKTVHVRARYYQDDGEDALVMLASWRLLDRRRRPARRSPASRVAK